MTHPAILIVSRDGPPARELECRLGRLGFQVYGLVPTIADALRHPEGLRPGLVLLDEVLARIPNGVDPALKLRSHFQVPVVLLGAAAGERFPTASANVTITFASTDADLSEHLVLIWDRHRLAKRVRQLERWVAEAIGDVADAIVTTDSDGVVTSFNRAAEASTGSSRVDAVGRQIGDVLRVVTQPRATRIELDPRPDHPLVYLANDATLLDKRGAARPIDLSSTRLMETDGQADGTLVIFREAGRHRSSTLFQLIADVGVASAQALALPELLQLCADSLVRRLDAVEVSLWTPNAVGEKLVLQARSGVAAPAAHVRGTIRFGEGEVGWVALHSATMLTNDVAGDTRTSDHAWAAREGIRSFAGYPLLVDSRLVGVLAVFSRSPLLDSTSAALELVSSSIAVGIERKRLEEQLRQSSKMEAVGQLAGGVAHDFNNLLTIINGYSEILQPQLPESSPLLESVREITQAGKRAASLTKQLLAFSRKQVLEPKVLDLNAIVLDLQSLLRRLLGEDVALTTSLDSALGLVKTDPGQIEQVLMNLVVNARDAMPRGGKLHIGTANVELDTEYARVHPQVVPGPHIRVTVSDTGVGMDEATKAHAFEPFFTTKSRGKGTGLGLATVYGIVTQSGGHVTLNSEPGRGSSFRIYLPRTWDTTRGKATEKGMATEASGSETILLTEDEGAVRALARHVLNMHGYTVLEAGNGKEALRVAEAHSGAIHLLVTDVIMPEMSGVELAEALHKLRPDTQVLFLSGYTVDAIANHGIQGGESAFLQKPFLPSGLMQKVREVLDRGKLRESSVTDDSSGL